MEKYELENTLQFLEQSQKADPLLGIHNYNSEMTISQIVKYFQRQNISFTKTMIQNYVRIGLLPPPIDKRFYNNNHLYMLTLIDSLKNVYSLDEIKVFFKMILKNFENFDDAIEDMIKIYNNFQMINGELSQDLEKQLPKIFSKNQNDNHEIDNFYIVMQFMVLSMISKNMAQMLLDT